MLSLSHLALPQFLPTTAPSLQLLNAGAYLCHSLKWWCNATSLTLPAAEQTKSIYVCEMPQDVLWKLTWHESWTTLLVRIFPIESYSLRVCQHVFFFPAVDMEFPWSICWLSCSCHPSQWVRESCPSPWACVHDTFSLPALPGASTCLSHLGDRVSLLRASALAPLF